MPLPVKSPLFAKSLLRVLLLAILPLTVQANEDLLAHVEDKAIQTLLQEALDAAEQLTFNPTIIRAVRLQNAEQLSMDEILKRDQAWQQSDELDDFKRSLQTNKAGRLLTRMVSVNSKFTEIFLTDSKGANVAAYPATSDYWQGDEDKFSQCFGPAKPVVLKPQMDRSTNTFSAQVSMPVRDGQQVIGVLVVGINLSGMRNGG
ncbi:MAG: PDC sensor domain-containing protein [Gammaproteobacteria bacterium]|nr:PDC sensor domain-containing protein [Gammaproteobacteria bacterium]